MTERIALFIDGANLHHTAKALGFEVDFKRLLVEFGKHGRISRAYFYTAISDAADFSSIRPLVNWLDYNGYTVRTKPIKEFDDGEDRRKFNRNIGVELAVDMLDIARYVDHIFLFSADGDLRCLAEAVQRLGAQLTVFQASAPNHQWRPTSLGGKQTALSSSPRSEPPSNVRRLPPRPSRRAPRGYFRVPELTRPAGHQA